MHRPIHWSALIPGLVVSGAIVAAASVVLIVGRVGAIHGPTERVYLATNRARAVIDGTDVWLDGKPVGKVVWVRFRPPTVDTAYRLLLALDVSGSIRHRLRRNTRAQITSGTSVIGAPVIDLASGSSAAPQLADGDTLTTPPQGELDGARASLALAAQNLPQIVENVRAVRAQAVATTGTIGALEGGASTARSLISMADNIGELSARTEYPGGTLHRLEEGHLMARVQRVIAQADSLRHAAATRAASADRSRDDSAMVHAIQDARAQLDDVQRLLASTAADSIADVPGAGPGMARVRHRMATLDAQLGALLTDMIRRPLRYIAF